MYDINTYYKFIAARFLLELNTAYLAKLFGVPLSKINSIESNSCKIPAIYSFAINSLISKEEKSEGIYNSLENDDLESFCRKIDKASKINRLSCSKCHSRNLHVMKIKEGIYFIECMKCKKTMYSSKDSAVRYYSWQNKGIYLSHYLYTKK
ncbi:MULTISPECIES: hypothetical protein [Aliivibrio]|uniref:hypothetical protein n=1 Tax=Aliivibrio TaxID=511678 RepID=UPI00039E487A|nr:MULTISPECIES: hypothetical protein [Aliivibrio]MBB1313732.1 hypothetical protein [Aliivibrio sp. SR45-2]